MPNFLENLLHEPDKDWKVGANIDSRPQNQKDKDYSASEIASGSEVEPFKNKKIKELTATVYDQWYTSSCVPHGFYTQLEYEGIVPKGFNPSQLRAYRKRVNYPSGGSVGTDMYEKIGAGQSNDFPVEKYFTEAKANAMPYVAGTKQIKDFNYFQYIDKKTGALAPELIPQDVANGRAISIFIYASEKEWSKEYVDLKDDVSIGTASVRHCVCLVPKGDFTEDGKKWLTVHDSARFGNRNLRYISYDFLLKRSYFGAKVIAKDTPVPTPEPIQEKPTLACEIGDRGEHVKSVQSFLIKQGKLEAKYLTGYYGALTAKAVLWWQLENWNKFSSNIPQLLEWAGKYWGSQSIEIAKKSE